MFLEVSEPKLVPLHLLCALETAGGLSLVWFCFNFGCAGSSLHYGTCP